MKKLVLILTALVVATATYSQCNLYFPLKQGSSFELTTYNAKEKVTGTVTYTVKEVRNDGTEADMGNVVKDEKGKQTSTADYTVKCVGTEMHIDIKAFVPSQTLEGYKDMEIKAKGDGFLIMPSQLTVGGSLPDGKSSWDINAKGSTTVMTTLSMEITNRKVVSKESITVPAGTFECYKITSDVKMESMTFGLSVPFTSKSEEYYAPGTGLVKSLTYSKNDKLMGSTALSKIVN